MYEIMFYVGLVLTLIFLVMSIVLFVRNNVGKLIGDVTGWNAKKAIRSRSGKHTAAKSETMPVKATELEETTVSGRIVSSDEEGTTMLPKQYGEMMGSVEEEETTLLVEEETTLLAEEETTLLAEEETTLLAEEETTLLAGEETTLLAGEETTLLAGEETTLLAGEETTLLAEEGTTLLATETLEYKDKDESGDVMYEEDVFRVEEDIVVTHTTEHIR